MPDMVLNVSSHEARCTADGELVTISTFPHCSALVTTEQIRDFELLRLAFFVLKRRKLERYVASTAMQEDTQAYTLRCNLLQHVIFQQVVCLTELGAYAQALQLIAASRSIY
jgi:hypothetical protein